MYALCFRQNVQEKLSKYGGKAFCAQRIMRVSEMRMAALSKYFIKFFTEWWEGGNEQEKI